MTLREQVAQVLWDTCRLRFDGKLASTELDDREMADAAVRVVLAAVTEQVDEPLRNRLHEIELDDVHGYERALDDVLAVLARLGEER